MKLPVLLTLIAASIGTAGAAATSVCALPLPPQIGAGAASADPSPMENLLLIDSDDNGTKGFWSRFVDDDDDDEDEDEDDECDDDDDGKAGCAAGGTGNAAPAGSGTPPKNGLFGNGTAPAVKTN